MDPYNTTDHTRFATIKLSPLLRSDPPPSSPPLPVARRRSSPCRAPRLHPLLPPLHLPPPVSLILVRWRLLHNVRGGTTTARVVRGSGQRCCLPVTLLFALRRHCFLPLVMSPVGIVVRRCRPPLSSVGAVATCVVVVVVVVSPSSRHGLVVSRRLLLLIVLLSVAPRRRPLLLLSSLVCSCPGHTHPARGSSFSICRPSSRVVVVYFSRMLPLAVVRLHCRPSLPSAVFLTAFVVSAPEGAAT